MPTFATIGQYEQKITFKKLQMGAKEKVPRFVYRKRKYSWIILLIVFQPKSNNLRDVFRP